jgi:hypothetical protein
VQASRKLGVAGTTLTSCAAITIAYSNYEGIMRMRIKIIATRISFREIYLVPIRTCSESPSGE